MGRRRPAYNRHIDESHRPRFRLRHGLGAYAEVANRRHGKLITLRQKAWVIKKVARTSEALKGRRAAFDVEACTEIVAAPQAAPGDMAEASKAVAVQMLLQERKSSLQTRTL